MGMLARTSRADDGRQKIRAKYLNPLKLELMLIRNFGTKYRVEVSPFPYQECEANVDVKDGFRYLLH